MPAAPEFVQKLLVKRFTGCFLGPLCYFCSNIFFLCFAYDLIVKKSASKVGSDPWQTTLDLKQKFSKNIFFSIFQELRQEVTAAIVNSKTKPINSVNNFVNHSRNPPYEFALKHTKQKCLYTFLLWQKSSAMGHKFRDYCFCESCKSQYSFDYIRITRNRDDLWRCSRYYFVFTFPNIYTHLTLDKIFFAVL